MGLKRWLGLRQLPPFAEQAKALYEQRVGKLKIEQGEDYSLVRYGAGGNFDYEVYIKIQEAANKEKISHVSVKSANIEFICSTLAPKGREPGTENRTVTPKRLPNRDLRTREYLTETEIERLIEAAKRNRHGHRDATIILTAYRHGLRAAELVDFRWDQVEFASATLHVRRMKQGTPSTHPLRGDELRALRRLQREQEPKSPFVFGQVRKSTPIPYIAHLLAVVATVLEYDGSEDMAIAFPLFRWIPRCSA